MTGVEEVLPVIMGLFMAAAVIYFYFSPYRLGKGDSKAVAEICNSLCRFFNEGTIEKSFTYHGTSITLRQILEGIKDCYSARYSEVSPQIVKIDDCGDAEDSGGASIYTESSPEFKFTEGKSYTIHAIGVGISDIPDVCIYVEGG